MTFFTESELKEISEMIHLYFNLVSVERIYDLILQVSSVDVALHLLMYHKRSNLTLDSIVYNFLQNKDNSRNT